MQASVRNVDSPTFSVRTRLVLFLDRVIALDQLLDALVGQYEKPTGEANGMLVIAKKTTTTKKKKKKHFCI